MGIEHLTDTNALPKDKLTVAVGDLAVSVDTVPTLPSQRVSTELGLPVEGAPRLVAPSNELTNEVTASNYEEWQALSKNDKLKVQRELVENFRTGDMSSFERLYEFYQPAIYRFVRSRTDEETAQDITQTVFLKCLRKINQFTDRGEGISPWLYSIARNALTDEYARRSRHPASDLDDEAIMALANRNSYDSIEERVLSKISAERALPALVELPTAAQYEAVTEVYLQGKTLAEYAQETGESVVAVKARLHRARENLRPLLQRLLSDQGDNTIAS